MNNPNIIFILVDALRAKNVGILGYEKKNSPNIDLLAKKGTTFSMCFSCSNASDSALTCLMSGMYPRSHGITHHSYEVSEKQLKNFDKRKVELLQQVLKKNEYKTFGLDFLARWHMRGYDYYPELKIDRTKRKKKLNRISRFFDFFGVKPLFRKLNHTKIARKILGGFDSYPKDVDTTKKAIELMNSTSDPYFLFIHYWGVHKPYTCPMVENKLSIECYDNAIETVDAHIKTLMENADKNTIFIVLGDHGESLGEHGIEFDHHGLYDPSLHVPLIFSGPNIPQQRIIDDLVSTIDIFPTLLDLIGIDYKKEIDGISLVNCMYNKNQGRDFIFAEENYFQDKACIRTKEYKFIKTLGRSQCGKCKIIHGGNEIELYNLFQDPGENNNIYRNNERIIEPLEKEMRDLLKNEKS
jgi:arylsulfatase